jgi:hypothetical protein
VGDVTGVDIDSARAGLAQDGYCILGRLLGAEELAGLQAVCDRAIAEDRERGEVRVLAGGTVDRLWALLNSGDEFVPLATHPVVLEVVRGLLGAGYLLGSLNAVMTEPEATGQLLHCDQQYLGPHFATGPAVAAAIWMIDEFTSENGGTVVVPGSHLLGCFPAEDEARGRLSLDVPAGGCAIIDGRLWHGTGANHSGGRRRGVFGHYYAAFLRSHESWCLSLPPEVAERHPELLNLLGFTPQGMLGTVNGPPIETMSDARVGIVGAPRQ